ncbi:hypothetical protein [Pseudomonas nitroreducens]|uniref:hypothetical protein n=1 Tax=Pseudomonas nitroreducens TaxID=46680 RepID=UPI0018754452|nr:hypothetical protein [Pseudomonas nitritireducens]
MKRLQRNPEKFEVIDLFTSVGKGRNYRLRADENFEDFIMRMRDSLKSSMANANLLHGKRIEALFSYVAGALGECLFIKKEDAGAVFSNIPNIQPPDYTVTLKNGSRMMIEVKNCHIGDFKTPYKLKKDYLKRLENYAAMQGAQLKIAIYFSRLNKWCLLSKSSLTEKMGRYEINMISAIAKSEMAILGDRSIGVKPDIGIEFMADPEKESSINDDGTASLTISKVRIFNAGVEIHDYNEKSIAFYLARFGKLTCDLPQAIQEDGRLISIKFDFRVDDEDELHEGQEFLIVGDLSSMITNAYNEHTVYEQSVVSLDPELDPDFFAINIDPDHVSKDLPLWQFSIQPNHDFLIN